MILGTGIDVCTTRRLRERLTRPDDDVLAAVFTGAEIAWCRGQRYPERHLAARFAAKEATVKALAAAGDRGQFWQDIEIVEAAGQRPTVRLGGRAAACADGLGVRRAWLSLSHGAELAVAGVILEGADD